MLVVPAVAVTKPETEQSTKIEENCYRSAQKNDCNDGHDDEEAMPNTVPRRRYNNTRKTAPVEESTMGLKLLFQSLFATNELELSCGV